MKRVRLAIIVPTRNRAELAVASVNSVLNSYKGDDVAIIISDNSTDVAESCLLDEYASHVDGRVELIRPTVPSGMTAHWNFAVEYALLNSSFTHFTILTDRMLFKADSINEIMGVLESFPDEVLSYTYDRIHDLTLPAIFRPLPRSGKLIRIESAKMLALSSQMSFPSCLPRMLNSVISRELLENLMARSGQIFSSIAPDFNFCYHTLGVCRSFIFYDKSTMINYSQGRSNGASFARGVITKDSHDFIEQIGKESINACSPLPEILTVGNSIVHEYCAEKGLSHSDKFPDISIGLYMDLLAVEVLRFEDLEGKRNSLRLLREHGWMPNSRFRLTRWKITLIDRLLGLHSRSFDTVKEAISYASTHRATGWPWFSHPARRYGLELPASASRRGEVD